MGLPCSRSCKAFSRLDLDSNKTEIQSIRPVFMGQLTLSRSEEITDWLFMPVRMLSIRLFEISFQVLARCVRFLFSV
jgi:hypothetical protein